MENITIIRPES